MKYKKEDEKVISNSLNSPFNIIPKGYPNKVRNKKIEETIDKLLIDLKNNPHVEDIVKTNLIFINLGSNELDKRSNKRKSSIALIISISSVLFAGFSLLISILR